MDRKQKMTEAEAIRLAREKYPECYETIDIGEGLEKQCIDINALSRAANASHFSANRLKFGSKTTIYGSKVWKLSRIFRIFEPKTNGR